MLYSINMHILDVPCIEWGTSKAYFMGGQTHVVLEFLAVLPERRLVELGALLAGWLPSQVLLLLLPLK